MKIEPLIESILPSESKMEHETLIEASTGVKSMWIKGISMQAEIKNRNGRIYPLHEMVNAVAQLNEAIKESKGVLGELDHPPDSLSINYKNVSHVIKEAYMDGNSCITKCLLLNTPCGLIAQEVFKSGVIPSVSSRGTGMVMEDSRVTGFNIVTIDLVVTPSAMNAHPSVMYESKQGKKVLSLAEHYQNDSSAQKYFKKEMQKFLAEFFKK